MQSGRKENLIIVNTIIYSENMYMNTWEGEKC